MSETCSYVIKAILSAHYMTERQIISGNVLYVNLSSYETFQGLFLALVSWLLVLITVGFALSASSVCVLTYLFNPVVYHAGAGKVIIRFIVL